MTKPSFAARCFFVATMIFGVAHAADAVLPPDARQRYQDAVALVGQGQYREAVAALNALAADFPRVAEVFASRCSAQIGQGANAGAEADCAYAVTLKPTLASAVYGLAVAEDNQGKAAKASEHYRRYAVMPDAIASLKAQALVRVRALEAPQPLAVAPPPPPPAATTAAPAPVAVQPAGERGTIYIYRNHYFQSGDQQVTLLIDDVVVGDIAHDQYVEVQLPAGEHLVEACIGGVRYRHSGGIPFLEIHSHNGTFGARVGGGEERRERYRGITVPVEVSPNGQTYVNFDHAGNRVLLQQINSGQGAEEIRSDCRRAYSRKL